MGSMSETGASRHDEARRSPGGRLRDALERSRPLVVPGCADALTARLAEAAGFEAVYATGAGFANAALGVPDIGLTSMSEAVEQVDRLCDAVDVPLIADIDTGFGNALNVRRTVRAVERAGAAAVQIEDQGFPKRCGHFSGKAVIPLGEMLGKLQAALEARHDPDFVVVARTDAIAVEGLDAAVDRAQAYAELGADLVFVEAPRSREELATLPSRIGAPLVANMVEGGVTPLLGAAELADLGYRVVLYANTALRVAARATQAALLELRARGDTSGLLDRMLGWPERQALVGLPELEALAARYAEDRQRSKSGGAS